MKILFQRRLYVCGAAVAAFATLTSGIQSASAASIKMQGAVGVTTNMGALPASAFSSGGASNINSVIDKVGLYRAYTNGEDQASYLANNTNANPDALHSDRQSREWFASAGTTTGDVDFDLGGVFSIANVVLWNEDVFGIKEFDILAANNADLSDLTYVNSFIAADQAVSPLNVPSFVEQAQVFDLGSVVSARYIRLLIGTAYPYEAPNRDNVAAPGFRSASIGEVAFGVVDPIPTPAMLPGLIGLGVSAWRKKRKIDADT